MQIVRHFGIFDPEINISLIDREAEAAYAPSERIHPGYVPPKVQRVYPPLQELD